jgi:methyl-accepting chemotaxis protein
MRSKETQRAAIVKRLVILWCSFIIGLIGFLTFFYSSFFNSYTIENQNMVKNLSNAGVRQVAYFYEQEQQGLWTRSQVQRRAMQALENIEFGELGYFWVNNSDNTLLMHPNQPNLVGKDLTHYMDKSSQHVFREFTEIALNGGGWLRYVWPKPGETDPVEKLSYVVYFEPWDWVIGIGLYVDDMASHVNDTIIRATWLLIAGLLVFFVLMTIWAHHLIRKLESLAIRDHLTGFYTSRYLNEVAPKLLKNDERQKDQTLSVLFLDIDYFKSLNDSYGHAFGDAAISTIAKSIEHSVDTNAICIRYGGEEFLVVSPISSQELLNQVAERIRQAVESTVISHGGSTTTATISIGVAMRHGNECLESTIKRADSHLYQAKLSGRNQVVSVSTVTPVDVAMLAS